MGRRPSLLLFLCLFLAQLGGRPSYALVTPTQTSTINPAYAVWGPNTQFQGGPLVFDKFDSSLGTLASVNLEVTYSFRNQVSMTFTNPAGAQTISLTTALAKSPNTGPTITLGSPTNGPLSTLLTVSAPVVSYTKTYGGNGVTQAQTFSNNTNQYSPDSPYFLTPDGMPDNKTSTFTGTRTITLTDPSLIALFTGSGTFVLPAQASFGSTLREAGNNDYGSLITYAGMSINLTYTYVPEPSSVALLGLGVGGVLISGKLRRRYRKPE